MTSWNEKKETNGCHPFVLDDDNKEDNVCDSCVLDDDTKEDDANTRPCSLSLFRMGYDEKKGRGLYATQIIPPHTVIHIAPCIRIDQNEYNHYMKYTILEHYLFNDIKTGNKLLALGYGSLFNHSSRPNMNYTIDSNNVKIIYKSGYKTIEKDEELCITYGSNLWFDTNDDDNNDTDTRNHSNDVVENEGIVNDDDNEDEENFLNQIEIDDDNQNE